MWWEIRLEGSGGPRFRQLGAVKGGWGGTRGEPLCWNGPCRLSGGWLDGPHHRHGIQWRGWNVARR